MLVTYIYVCMCMCVKNPQVHLPSAQWKIYFFSPSMFSWHSFATILVLPMQYMFYVKPTQYMIYVNFTKKKKQNTHIFHHIDIKRKTENLTQNLIHAYTNIVLLC